jgi:transaldolase
MPTTEQLKIKLFCDGADFDSIIRMYKDPIIRGFTTNPTLMRKAGVSDYESFGRKLLAAVPDRPVSLEVFADDVCSMERQAREIATWGPNVNVKIPVTNTEREFTGPLINRLSRDGIELNITAIMTLDQIRAVADALDADTPAIISVFAGRIADTGIDPVPLMAEGLSLLKDRPKAKLLWASPRELLNVFQADEIGCHIITATPDILVKLKLVGKDLSEYSLDTVKMFYTDATAAGFSIRFAKQNLFPQPEGLTDVANLSSAAD